MVKDKGTILFFFIIFLILYAGKSIEQTKGDMNGQETIKYNLIKSSIEAVSYALTFDSTYSIDIKLTKKSTEEFRELTKNNIGKSLRIFKAGGTGNEGFLNILNYRLPKACRLWSYQCARGRIRNRFQNLVSLSHRAQPYYSAQIFVVLGCSVITFKAAWYLQQARPYGLGIKRAGRNRSEERRVGKECRS